MRREAPTWFRIAFGCLRREGSLLVSAGLGGGSVGEDRLEPALQIGADELVALGGDVAALRALIQRRDEVEVNLRHLVSVPRGAARGTCGGSHRGRGGRRRGRRGSDGTAPGTGVRAPSASTGTTTGTRERGLRMLRLE